MIVGIDLGTTNSAVAVWENGGARILPNSLGDLLTPSAVSVEEDGTMLVGIAARDRMATHAKSTTTAFKRLMGTQQKVKLGRQEFSAEDLSAIVLRSLKADAEAATGETVTGAVITVPAYYNDRQRKATRRAGELAGLNVQRLINEPTAAALAFGIKDRSEKEPFLVFDLGGGTFDVSIVEMFDGIIEVRATAGDNRLGGEDFNGALVALARPRIDAAGKLNRNDPRATTALLDQAAERTRRALTESDSAPFTIAYEGETFTTEITAAEFEKQATTLIDRLRDPVLRSLRDSKIRVDALSEVVLVGGATRMPIVRKAITRMFGRFPNMAVHPDHAVALGAAVQAGLLSRDAALDEVRLTDVCPFTLGVSHTEIDPRGNYRHGLFSPIIDRNTALPVSRMNFYNTISEQQKLIEFEIYQGEAREVAQNVKLGSLRVPVPPRRAGEIHVECRFTYDASGMLEIDVTVPATGAKHEMTIFDDADAMSPAEIAARRDTLAKLKVHPREEASNVALLARATRCYEGFTGESRLMIGQWITAFEAALASQDARTIAGARDALAAELDILEGDRFL